MKNKHIALAIKPSSPLKQGSWMKRFLLLVLDAQEKYAETRSINTAVRQLSLLDDKKLSEMGLSREMIRSSVIDRTVAERRDRFGW
jgi:hypothetical protein